MTALSRLDCVHRFAIGSMADLCGCHTKCSRRCLVPWAIDLGAFFGPHTARQVTALAGGARGRNKKRTD
jgi:hypothetical protein